MTNKERDEFIAEQLNKGVSLSDVQSALAKDFNIKMTYFELRMVAMGLDVDWEKQDKQVQKPKAEATMPIHAEESDEEFEDEEEDEKDVRAMPDFVRKSAANKPLDGEDEEDDEAPVTIDEVPLAGSQLSGKVKFASGASGIWFLGPRGLGYNRRRLGGTQRRRLGNLPETTSGCRQEIPGATEEGRGGIANDRRN